MERDFMGLSSKKPMVMVKEEIINDSFKDSGYAKGFGGVQWPFPSKVSALPHHFMAFKVEQEDKMMMRKNNSEPPHIFSGFGPFPIAAADAAYDQTRAVLEFQNSFNIDRQQQRDVYNAKMFAAAATMKQQFLGGIPLTSPNMVLPTACSIPGIAEPWSNTKPSGCPAQLTIFYDGAVNVYDNISPEKARAIMFLAGSSSSLASNAPANLISQAHTPASGTPMNQPLSTPNSALSSPSSMSSHTGTQSGSGSTSTDDMMAAKTAGVPTTPLSKAEPPKMMNPATAMMPSAVPQARKASLARFLEKRKERMMNAAPYNLCKSSSECTAAESNGANFSTSPAADSRLH